MPVIVLCTATDKAPSEKRVISVPWPCETKALVERIEAALLGGLPPTSHRKQVDVEVGEALQYPHQERAYVVGQVRIPKHTPGPECVPEILYLLLPCLDDLQSPFPRAPLAALLYLPLVHRRVCRAHRPLKDDPQVVLVHVPVGDPGAVGLGGLLHIEGGTGLPPEGYQPDPQQVGKQLCRLRPARTPTRLDLEEIVAAQVRSSGELGLAYPLAHAPVPEAREGQASALDRRLRLTKGA